MAPPGWPAGLVEPGKPGFVDSAVRWLLDAAPGDLRLSPLRAYPQALAMHVHRIVEAQLDATRASYARTRTDLAHAPDAVPAVLAALEAEGSRLLALAREVALVEQAILRERP